MKLKVRKKEYTLQIMNLLVVMNFIKVNDIELFLKWYYHIFLLIYFINLMKIILMI